MKVVLYSKRMGVNAVGEYNPKTGELIVQKGSTVSLTLSESKTFKGRAKIEQAREGVLDGNVLIKDVRFNSPSTAANFVAGGSSNGLRMWKNEDGVAIGKLKKEA